MLNLPGMQETRKKAASKTEEETALLKACDERVMKPGRKWRPPLRRDQAQRLAPQLCRLIDPNAHSPNGLAARFAVIRNYSSSCHADLFLTRNLSGPFGYVLVTLFHSYPHLH